MSTQSIYKKTIDTVQKEMEDSLLKNANNYLLKRRFALGQGECQEDIKHSMKILGFICTENCELLEYIKRTLKGEELPKKTCLGKRTIMTTLEFSDYTRIFEENLG